MPVTRPLFESIRGIVAAVSGAPREELSPLTRMSDLGLSPLQVTRIYRRACAEHGVALSDIETTRPYAVPLADERTLASLQIIAPFSSQAIDLLRRLDGFPDDDTLSSLAESIDEGAYVASGFRTDGLHPPHSRAGVLLAGGFCLAVCWLFLPLAISAILGQASAFWTALPFGIALGAVIAGWAVAPGLAAMRRDQGGGRWQALS